jgi:hypothetical protein
MKAETYVLLSAQVPSVRITHRDVTLSFSISVFGRGNFQNGYDVFEHINEYWAHLSDVDQDAIFAIYTRIHQSTENNLSKDDLIAYLSDQVTQLLEYHHLPLIQDWVMFRSNIHIPDAFGNEYLYSVDQNTSREKTYTRSDYVQLVALSVALRCMVPVWGEHISYIRKDSGTLFKEFYAFQLLSKSPLLQSEPIEKLKIYIDNIAGAGKFDPNNTLKGISSEDFGYWLLSLVCVRRLCIGDIRGLDPRANMVTFIYKYIIQKVHSNDNNFENIIKEKKFDDRSQDSENKISTLERYKIKTNISPGEIVELEYSVRDIRGMANRLSTQISPDMLERSLLTSDRLIKERILDPQITLLRWVFKSVISPRGIMYLSAPMIVRALGALEAVLWARGHRYLALLATSHMVHSDREMVISPVDSKMRVPKELNDELISLYPYQKSLPTRKVEVKEINRVAESIDRMADQLMMFSWRITADESMIQEVLGTTSRRMPIKPDIKTDLTKLVIELGRRSWL